MVIHAFLLFCGFAVSNGISNNIYENMDVLDERGTAKKQYSSNFLLYGCGYFLCAVESPHRFYTDTYSILCVVW